jgi:hypothetical protein
VGRPRKTTFSKSSFWVIARKLASLTNYDGFIGLERLRLFKSKGVMLRSGQRKKIKGLKLYLLKIF